MAEAHIEPRSDEPNPEDINPSQVAGFNDFTLAKSFMAEGLYREAVAAFNRYIDENPGEILAQKSLKGLLSCYKKMDGDFSDLRSDLADLAETYGEAYPALAWAARRVAYRCTFSMDRFEDAKAEIESILDDAPSERQRLYAQMDALLIDEFSTGDRINSTRSYDREMETLEQKIENTLSAAKNGMAQPPQEFLLQAAYPNPFNSMTTIRYQMPISGRLELRIYDTSGREVASLVNEEIKAGYHEAVWEAAAPSGIYMCRMKTSNYENGIKLVLTR